MYKRVTVSRFPGIETLVIFCLAASTVLLGVSGFCVTSLSGAGLTGYLLLVHTGLGGLFAVSLAALAVLRAQAYRFGPGSAAGPFSFLQRLCFWGMGLLGLVLILSMVVAMFPVLGTEGQHACVQMHRSAAWGAVLVTVLYGLVSLRRS